MNSVKQFFIDFYKDEEGLTTVEYAVAGALVVGAVAAAFSNLGTVLSGAMNDIGDAISSAGN